MGERGSVISRRFTWGKKKKRAYGAARRCIEIVEAAVVSRAFCCIRTARDTMLNPTGKKWWRRILSFLRDFRDRCAYRMAALLRQPRRVPAPTRRRVRLCVEELEDRSLPSVSLLGDSLLDSGAEGDAPDDPLIDPISALEARILDEPKIDWGILAGFSDPATPPNIQSGASGGASAPASAGPGTAGGTSAPAGAGPGAAGPIEGEGNQQGQQALYDAAGDPTNSIQSLPGLNSDDPPTV